MGFSFTVKVSLIFFAGTACLAVQGFNQQLKEEVEVEEPWQTDQVGNKNTADADHVRGPPRGFAGSVEESEETPEKPKTSSSNMVEEPVEEAEDYAELAKVDWTQYVESRVGANFPYTDLDGSKKLRTQRFKDTLCHLTDEDERCCQDGEEEGEKPEIWPSLFQSCRTASESERNELCRNQFRVCCERNSLKKFYVHHIHRAQRTRKHKKKKNNSQGV